MSNRKASTESSKTKDRDASVSKRDIPSARDAWKKDAPFAFRDILDAITLEPK